jgi:hypothetical protein
MGSMDNGKKALAVVTAGVLLTLVQKVEPANAY